jgi:putative transcriptional regulator
MRDLPNHNEARKMPKPVQKYKLEFTLADLLKERGISQRHLSKITGIRFATINEMCRNLMNYIQIDNVSLIAQTLECEPWDFIKYVPMTNEEIEAREAKLQELYEKNREGEVKRQALKKEK